MTGKLPDGFKGLPSRSMIALNSRCFGRDSASARLLSTEDGKECEGDGVRGERGKKGERRESKQARQERRDGESSQIFVEGV